MRTCMNSTTARIRPAGWALVGMCLTAAASADTISLNPKSTYLRTHQDTPAAPAVVSLPTHGLAPGDWIELTALGDFSVGAGFGDTTVSLLGVFSASSQIAATDQLHRVVAAIDAGTDYVTSATWFGSLPTDIDEDFAIGLSDTQRRVTVQIPAGATHLVVGVVDSYYADNTDPDGDLAVRIERVPEPASAALIGLGALFARRRRA